EAGDHPRHLHRPLRRGIQSSRGVAGAGDCAADRLRNRSGAGQGLEPVYDLRHAEIVDRLCPSAKNALAPPRQSRDYTVSRLLAPCVESAMYALLLAAALLAAPGNPVASP